MKKVIFVFLFILTVSIGYSQVAVTTSPQYGCPNMTQDITVTVTNNSGYSIPPGIQYDINVTVQTPAPVTTIGTFSQSYTDGFATGASRSYTVDVTFQGPMTCDVSGTLYVPAITATYPYSTTYSVQYPPTLTIAENPVGTLEVQTAIGSDQVQFFKDGNLEMTTTNTTFTPTASGNYTAKLEDVVTGCLSQNFSNAIAITVATTDVKEGQNTSVSVYPNPMASSVTITTVLSNKLKYELVDLNGTVVRSADFTTATNMNVENLKAGSYMLTVKDNDQKVASYKLVK